ncbi:methylation-associated defense system DNA methyltransferase MAD2 [Streptomyces gibsoniae]|uniref:N-6 DNA methylase n=1 Tax=Streptomyces gibsoniae TaxID=3075529 RepID=A0ABU2U6C1_9ACTN|nr:N-6 DNA methylase [Streptomyces sp. DSM 41699]MDT0468729.1 N-6 DNA methylase [Streptomyces sp. DSM 41699]
MNAMEELTLELATSPADDTLDTGTAASAAAVAAVEEAAPEAAPVTQLEEGKIIDYITGEPVTASKKEQVRQRTARALYHEHGISPADMARDFPLPVATDAGARKRTKKADLAIFAHDAEHTPENVRRVIICKPEPKLGRNVIKLRDPEQASKDLEDLKDLMGGEERPLCTDGLWTDGLDFFFLRKTIHPTYGPQYEDTADWEAAPESIGSRAVASHQRLRRAEPERLKIAFRRCHNYIHGNEGMPKDAAFWQFLYLLFTKMYDERISRTSDRPARFRVGMTERFTAGGRDEIRKRIDGLFGEVKSVYRDLFKPSDEITLSDKALAFIVAELSPYDLSATDIDAKGIAYQELVGVNLRGDRGQYFTPRGAVKLMVEILDPQEHEKVLDPTCGTGGFLQETLNHFHHKWQKQDGTFGFPDDEEQQLRYREKLREYAENRLFGSDFDPFLVRATTMNIMTLANTTGHIVHMDSLAFPEGGDRFPGVAVAKDLFPLGSVDVVLTNPPFGADIPISDVVVLNQYRGGVARSWSRDKATGELLMSPSTVTTMAPEQLFIQRAIEWVKPGGRVGIVLPNGILSNPGPTDEAIRRYILNECYLLASVELPVETFIVDANVNILTTLLFLQKKTQEEKDAAQHGAEKSYPVFMAVAEKVGFDRRGNPLYKRTPSGEIVMETTEEIEWINVGGKREPRKLTRSREAIDNDLPIIAKKYKEFRKKHGFPGLAAQRAREGQDGGQR